MHESPQHFRPAPHGPQTTVRPQLSITVPQTWLPHASCLLSDVHPQTPAVPPPPQVFGVQHWISEVQACPLPPQVHTFPWQCPEQHSESSLHPADRGAQQSPSGVQNPEQHDCGPKRHPSPLKKQSQVWLWP